MSSTATHSNRAGGGRGGCTSFRSGSNSKICSRKLQLAPMTNMFGLSKERPILDHHAKAHIPWNPADFMKSGGFHTDFIRISWNPADFTMKSGGFHHEIRQISWNPVKSGGFQVKSGRFHEIREIQRISPRYHLWNPPKIIKASVSAKTLQFDECRVGDFTLKSGGFQLWNLVDFTQISPVKSTQSYKSKCFSKNSSVWWMQGGGFHPWNPVDFTLENGGFHLWNLVDFTQISPVKSTQDYKSKCFSKNSSVWWMQGGGYDQGFHEIHQISPWEMVDFTHEIWQISPRFNLWNPPKIIKAIVSAKTLQFDECRGGGFHPWNPMDFTLKSGGFHPWNLADFTQIWPVKSTQNYKSKCFSENSSVWWVQGGGFHPRNLVDFTLKSGGFQPWNLVDFTQISPVKSTQNYKSKCFKQKLFSLMNAGWGLWPRISWNPPDFTMRNGGFHPWNLAISPRFHLWNPPKIIKAIVSAKTLQFDECRVGAMTKDFTHEIWWISPRFHLWNPPQIYKSKCFSKKLFSLMNAGWGLWPRISWNPPDFTWNLHKIHWISKLWAFAWWFHFSKDQSEEFLLKHLIGLLKVERPILDHHTKDHNLKSGRFHHKIWWISPEIWQISPWNPPRTL